MSDVTCPCRYCQSFDPTGPYADYDPSFPRCRCGHIDTEHNRATAHCLECDCEMFIEPADA